jgi:hypothetical protein
MTDLSPSLLGLLPKDAANTPLPPPQTGEEQQRQSARILARSQYSQQDNNEDKTNTPFTLVACHGTTRNTATGTAIGPSVDVACNIDATLVGPHVTPPRPTSALNKDTCLTGNQFAVLATDGEMRLPNKVAGNLTTAIPWGEFFDIITVPPPLAANDAITKAIVEMLWTHGRIADDAIQ